jgi:hypothetical protein
MLCAICNPPDLRKPPPFAIGRGAGGEYCREIPPRDERNPSAGQRAHLWRYLTIAGSPPDTLLLTVGRVSCPKPHR